MKNYKKEFRIISILIILILFIYIFTFDSKYADFFAYNISNIFIAIMGSITSILPFALFEFVFIFLILFGLFLFIKIFKNLKIKEKEKSIKSTFNFFTYILSIILVYTLSTGVAYYRSPIPLPMYEGEIPISLVDEAIAYYLDDYNKLAESFEKDENNASICPYSFFDLAKKMQKEANRLNEYASDYYYKFTALPKPTLFSPILSELHITGVDFPFTAEANVNFSMPSIDIPFTMAHEIAHLKGVMKEDEANTCALFICITSSDPYIRYSGYFRGFWRLMEIKQYTNYKEYAALTHKVSPYVYMDNQFYNNYFKEHNLLEEISDFINDIYLMMNGQKEGTDSYDDKSDTEHVGNDEDGNEIRVYKNYSSYQKLLIQNYVDLKD